jgi:CRP-like cAMP-binding protein
LVPVSSDSEQAIPVVSIAEGEFVFHAGDPADAFFIVSTGHVELLRKGEAGRRLALLSTGDLLGEDSAFAGQIRAYDARAVKAATLLRVTTSLYLDLVRVRPELAAAVIGAISARLLQTRDACLRLALPSDGAAAADGAQPRFVHVESGQQFALPDAAEAVVGRADRKFRPEIELSAVDTRRSLSRRHAVVRRAGDGYEIVEQPGVANGTFVNGARLSPGVPVTLKEGDEVSFGLITTIFRTA